MPKNISTPWNPEIKPTNVVITLNEIITPPLSIENPSSQVEGGYVAATKVARSSVIRAKSIIQRNSFDLF